MDPKELPISIKTDLVAMSNQIHGEKERRSFCKNAAKRICEMAQDFVDNNKHALFYSAAGFVLGFIVKNGIKNIWGIGWLLGPIADGLPLLFGLGGAAKGFLEDCEDAALKRKIIRVIMEEYCRVNA